MENSQYKKTKQKTSKQDQEKQLPTKENEATLTQWSIKKKN